MELLMTTTSPRISRREVAIIVAKEIENRTSHIINIKPRNRLVWSIRDIDAKFQKVKRKTCLQDAAYIRFHNRVLIQKFKMFKTTKSANYFQPQAAPRDIPETNSADRPGSSSAPILIPDSDTVTTCPQPPAIFSSGIAISAHAPSTISPAFFSPIDSTSTSLLSPQQPPTTHHVAEAPYRLPLPPSSTPTSLPPLHLSTLPPPVLQHRTFQLVPLYHQPLYHLPLQHPRPHIQHGPVSLPQSIFLSLSSTPYQQNSYS